VAEAAGLAQAPAGRAAVPRAAVAQKPGLPPTMPAQAGNGYTARRRPALDPLTERHHRKRDRAVNLTDLEPLGMTLLILICLQRGAHF
jgi:hypothetical protein